MIALIDADILVYEAAHRSQTNIDWDQDGEAAATADFPQACEDIRANIEFISKKTGCDNGVLVLTDSDRDANFRRRVWPEYKAHRGDSHTARPLLFHALREWMHDDYTVKEKPGIEGDDTLGIMATGDIVGLPADRQARIICSIDKDLLTVPGRHFNWRRASEGIVTVTDDEAYYNLLYQTLCGDSTDNFPGLPGCGPVGAKRILDDASGQSMREMWEHVVIAFEERDLSRADALVQARCARILQASDWDFNNDRPILWTEPEEER